MAEPRGDNTGDEGDDRPSDGTEESSTRFYDEINNDRASTYVRPNDRQDRPSDSGLGILTFNTRDLYRREGEETPEEVPENERVDPEQKVEPITATVTGEDGQEREYKLVRGRDGKYEVRDANGRKIKGDELQRAQEAMENAHGFTFDSRGKVEGRIMGRNSNGDLIYKGPQELDLENGSVRSVDGRVTEMTAGDYTARRDGNGRWQIIGADGQPVKGEELKKAQQEFANELGFELKFDRQGKIQGDFQVDSDGQIKYSYKQGRYDVSQVRDSRGNVERDITQTFTDSAGRERTVSYDSNTGQVNGVVIKGEDGKVERAMEFERGEDGKIERITVRGPDGYPQTYHKGSDGNWPPGLAKDLGLSNDENEELQGDIEVNDRGVIATASENIIRTQNEDGSSQSFEYDSFMYREYDAEGNPVAGSELYFDGTDWREPERDEETGEIKTDDDGNILLKATGREGEPVKMARVTTGGDDQLVTWDANGNKTVIDLTKGNGEKNVYDANGELTGTYIMVGDREVKVTTESDDNGEYYKPVDNPGVTITVDSDGNTVESDGQTFRKYNRAGELIETGRINE